MSMTFIKHIEVDVARTSIEFTAIPQTYTDLFLVFTGRSSRVSPTTDDVVVQLNSDATNQSTRWLWGSGSGTLSATDTQPLIGEYPTSTYTANTFGSYQVYIPNYTSSNPKSFSADGVGENNATAAYQVIAAGLYNSTDAITSILIKTGSGSNLVEYSSATLYGITNAVEPIIYTLPVTSDLYAWYDAANTSTITASSGLISEWADSSGNGIDAVQADTAFQPSFGTVVCNGVVVPYFNVDRLIATASLTGNALTVFTVGSKELAVSGSSVYSRWASIWKSGAGANDYNNANSILALWAATVYVYGNSTQIATVNTTAANGIHNSAFRLDGSAVKLWHNGATATGTTSVSLNADRITIGDAAQGTGDSYLNGFVAEHIIYNRALTDQEVADVQAYLANKWGLS